MVKKMELTLENLMNEIIKQESLYRTLMIDAKNSFGMESNNFKLWNAKWSVLYDLAKEFDLVDKLKR